VPKKLLVYASAAGTQLADARGMGWDVTIGGHDWPALIAAKDTEIDRLSSVYLANLKKAGVVIHEGHARLVDAHTVEVAGQRVRAATILVATGGAPRRPEIPGADLMITSDEAFHLPTLPAHIAVVGAGYIGVEFAHIFAGLGAKVTLVHRYDRVLPGFDPDVRANVEDGFARAGIRVIANEYPRSVERAGDQLAMSLGTTTVLADLVMASIGRHPATAGLGLAELGVALDARGAVVVDEWSRSSVPHIYAVGDVSGRVALTPVAIREAHAFADTVFGGRPTPVPHDLIPTAVFSQPPCAFIGLPEDLARKRGIDVTIYATRFKPMRHALTGRDERTFIKMVVDTATRRVLGLHMVGDDAPEIVQAASVAITMGATKDDFDRTFAIHPTAAEELVLLR
jgi:glutathione reductase (NADPH)